MRKGRLWKWLGLGSLALCLSVSSAGAQEFGVSVPPPQPAGQGAPIMPANVIPAASHTTVTQTGHNGTTIGCDTCVVESEHAESTGLFVVGEFLWVRPRRRNLDFVIQDPTNNGSIDGQITSLNWESKPAYRLGAGYRLGNGWEVGGYYFYLHSNNDKALTAPAGGALFATLTNPNIDQVSAAAAFTNLDMDVVDVEFAKTLRWHKEDLTLRLAAGPRFADIQQKFNAVYSGGVLGNANGAALVSSPIGFDGWGLRVGGESYWNIFGGLSLYAKAYGSLLMGEFRTNLRESLNGGALTSINVAERFEKVVPVTELGIGIAWSNENIRIRLGYELANWFGMVDSVDFVEGRSFGKTDRRVSDLSLEALSLQIGLFF
jgi:hypothetical protein